MVTGSSRLLNASYFTLEQNRRHKARFVMDRHCPPVSLGVAAMTGTALAHVGIMSKQELFPGTDCPMKVSARRRRSLAVKNKAALKSENQGDVIDFQGHESPTRSDQVPSQT